MKVNIFIKLLQIKHSKKKKNLIEKVFNCVQTYNLCTSHIIVSYIYSSQVFHFCSYLRNFFSSHRRRVLITRTCTEYLQFSTFHTFFFLYYCKYELSVSNRTLTYIKLLLNLTFTKEIVCVSYVGLASRGQSGGL